MKTLPRYIQDQILDYIDNNGIVGKASLDVDIEYSDADLFECHYVMDNVKLWVQFELTLDFGLNLRVHSTNEEGQEIEFSHDINL